MHGIFCFLKRGYAHVGKYSYVNKFFSTILSETSPENNFPGVATANIKKSLNHNDSGFSNTLYPFTFMHP